jgi:hypothetical protein
MKEKKYIVAVDIDGTIRHQWDGYPLIGAKEFLRDLSEFAHIIIYTCRCCQEVMGNSSTPIDFLRSMVEDWLRKHDMTYDEIYVGQGKPFANAYVDDRAVNVPINPSQVELEIVLRQTLKVCNKERVFKDQLSLEQEAATGGSGVGILSPYINTKELLLRTVLSVYKCTDNVCECHRKLIEKTLKELRETEYN